MHRKRLVSWDRPFVVEEGRVRDPVKRLVLIKDRDRSVSVIRTLPLAVDKLEQLLERPSRQPKGSADLASSHYKQELFNPWSKQLSISGSTWPKRIWM